MMKTTDYARAMQDALSNLPVDTSSVREAFKTQSALGEKMTRVALQAAERSTEVSAQWTKDALARVSDLATAKDQPADYAKAVSDFASAAAEMASQHMATYAEIAKKVQMDTVDLMLTAGKDMASEAQTAAQNVAETVGRQAEQATRKAQDAMRQTTDAPKA